jgi:hypothetical protein
MSAYVDQADLESMFTVERVAEVFSVQAVDGSTTGVADAATLDGCIRMGCAEIDRILMPVHDLTGPAFSTKPDTLKSLAGIMVMHRGTLRRPEYASDPKKSPYYEDWKQAREDLKEIRTSLQRLSPAQDPANVGGMVSSSNPVEAQPFYFLPNPKDPTRGGMQGF